MAESASISASDFTIGWLCAYSMELEIAGKMMDEQLARLPSDPSDSNIYALGLIEGHYVVAAYSPTAERGTSRVAIAARHMRLSFPSVCLSISIGIGSGVPRPGNEIDIRLDDVIISHSLENYGELIQYNLGKIVDGGVTRMENTIAPLSTTVMGALEKLRTNYLRDRTRVSEHLSKLTFLTKYDKPEEARATASQTIFHDSMVSSGEAIRDGSTSQSCIHELGDVSFFGTEAADTRTDVSRYDFPLVMIRGICNCADKRKSEKLQTYATAAAASCAKELLQILPPLTVAIGHEDQAAYQQHVDQGPFWLEILQRGSVVCQKHAQEAQKQVGLKY
ncbi:hypothetical protein LZ31DRAFT_564624 [Colletotrichum somersetense]|nr:hypothetical protein LZ31DRAFT_564624 [Colletotrichum somersetense]